MARHPAHRSKHALIGDAFALDGASDKFLPLAASVDEYPFHCISPVCVRCLRGFVRRHSSLQLNAGVALTFVASSRHGSLQNGSRYRLCPHGDAEANAYGARLKTLTAVRSPHRSKKGLCFRESLADASLGCLGDASHCRRGAPHCATLNWMKRACITCANWPTVARWVTLGTRSARQGPIERSRA